MQPSRPRQNSIDFLRSLPGFVWCCYFLSVASTRYSTTNRRWRKPPTGGYRFPRRSRRCCWCSAVPSRLPVPFASCLAFIGVRRPYCSYSTWSRQRFCFTTFGVSPSTAMRGMGTFGRSLRISGWLAVFSTLPPTQTCNRYAAPSRLVLARLKNERAQVEERRLWTTAVTRERGGVIQFAHSIIQCGSMFDQIHPRDLR